MHGERLVNAAAALIVGWASEMELCQPQLELGTCRLASSSGSGDDDGTIPVTGYSRITFTVGQWRSEAVKKQHAASSRDLQGYA